jgi:hypothetical protein
MSESQVAHKTVIWTAAVVTGAAAVGAIVYWAKRAHVYEQYVPIKVCERCLLDRRSLPDPFNGLEYIFVVPISARNYKRMARECAIQILGNEKK